MFGILSEGWWWPPRPGCPKNGPQQSWSRTAARGRSCRSSIHHSLGFGGRQLKPPTYMLHLFSPNPRPPRTRATRKSRPSRWLPDATLLDLPNLDLCTSRIHSANRSHCWMLITSYTRTQPGQSPSENKQDFVQQFFKVKNFQKYMRTSSCACMFKDTDYSSHLFFFVTTRALLNWFLPSINMYQVV
jgi:hypothetical protein